MLVCKWGENTMRMYDIIAKKRDGLELTTEEINFWVKEYVKGTIPDYQVSALLMAIFLQGMNQRETLDLTMAMASSGEQINLSSIHGITVDKHSTGGVGDKTTLVVGPLVAAAGVPVAKMSGRGLGHTGGTIDKLEAIPGFKTELPIDDFIQNVNKIGVAIAGQTGNLVPADKKIYALRDVTATVNHISLIASSIMSKKIASGSDAIVLDVKTGSGAFMKEEKDAFALAEEMIRIGYGANKEVVAVVSDMDQPLGYAVGNTLEVIEAIETLKGNGPNDLTELCLILGAHMLVLAKKVENFHEGKEMLKEKLYSGKALEKFVKLIQMQGGDPKVINDYHLFPGAAYSDIVISVQGGYVHGIDGEKVGTAALVSGAGRFTKESQIDLGAGIVLKKKVGEKVLKGDVLAVIYSNQEERLKDSKELLESAYLISSDPVLRSKLIRGVVTKDGIEKN